MKYIYIQKGNHGKLSMLEHLGKHTSKETWLAFDMWFVDTWMRVEHAIEPESSMIQGRALFSQKLWKTETLFFNDWC